jgi:cytoskeletal protein CcmA (bactofilin family)
MSKRHRLPAALPHARGDQEGSQLMLQPPNSTQKNTLSLNPGTYTPPKTVAPPVEQATIGRSLVIKGEVSGSESLYIDGRIEGSVNIADNRITIGRNGSVAANITAREVVIMGRVQGNIQCSDRLDVRADGGLTGDVITPRISVEDGAMIKGSVQVKAAEGKNEKHQVQHQAQHQPQSQAKPPEQPKPADQPKAISATASA